MSDILLPAPVQAMIDAINAGDTDAFVAAFTADGFVSDWGTVKAGADGVRGWADSDAIGAGARMTVLSAATDGDTTRIRDRFDINVQFQPALIRWYTALGAVLGGRVHWGLPETGLSLEGITPNEKRYDIAAFDAFVARVEETAGS